MSASTNETDMSTPTIVQIVSTKHQTDYSKSTINPVSITSELQTSTNIPSRTSTVTQTKNYSTQNSTDYSKSTSVKPKKKLCANFQLGTILFPVLMLFGLYSIVCSTGQVAGPILLAILHCLGQIFTPCVRPHPTIGLFIPPAHTYLSFHTVLGTHQFSQQGI
ncbi:hypothetical protein GQR58_029473 [Nymphon striatum]|nr:hypothetical protein GQR58_029473 [Nymphon striatum]